MREAVGGDPVFQRLGDADGGLHHGAVPVDTLRGDAFADQGGGDGDHGDQGEGGEGEERGQLDAERETTEEVHRSWVPVWMAQAGSYRETMKEGLSRSGPRRRGLPRGGPGRAAVSRQSCRRLGSGDAALRRHGNERRMAP